MSDQQKNNQEEIDLFTFLKPVAVMFGSMFSAIGKYLQLLFSNWLIVAVCIIVSTLAGFSLRFVLPPLYKTEAVFSTYEIPPKLCIILINNLQEVSAAKKNKAALSKAIGITTEQALAVSEIEASLMKDTFFVNNRDTVRNFISVKLVCSNPDFIPAVQNGLLRYLENNEFALKRKEAKRKMLKDLKQNLEQKVASLDSVKKIVNNNIAPRNEGRGIILGEPINPVTVYESEVNYYRELIDIERDLTIENSVEILQPFIATIRPNYPKFNLLMMFFAAGGLLLSMIIIPFRKKRT
jgi:hypothetical protein